MTGWSLINLARVIYELAFYMSKRFMTLILATASSSTSPNCSTHYSIAKLNTSHYSRSQKVGFLITREAFYQGLNNFTVDFDCFRVNRKLNDLVSVLQSTSLPD